MGSCDRLGPPHCLVLAWQIGADWRFDSALVTELEIRFSAESPTTARVDLEHRHLDRFGEKAAETRASLDSDGGWAGLLEVYTEAV